MDLKKETRLRWREGRFIETGHEIPPAEYPGIPWIPYEEYMKAQLVQVAPGELSKLVVDFPPEFSEDNQMHIHPISDRVITVIRGSGEFLAIRRRATGIERFALRPGHKVWMPRGIVHTFVAGKEGLTVESLHNPWVPFEHPLCLVYPRQGGRK